MNTKEMIIDAAINNIAEYGERGATMQKIAVDCDIKPASIYYFYKNKEEIITKVLERVLANHFQAMSETYDRSSELNPLETMQEMLEAIAEHHFKNAAERKVYTELMESSEDNYRERVASYLDTYNDWLHANLMKKLNDSFVDNNDLKKVLDHFLLIGNGVFWATNIYSEEQLQRDVKTAKQLMSYAYNANLF